MYNFRQFALELSTRINNISSTKTPAKFQTVMKFPQNSSLGKDAAIRKDQAIEKCGQENIYNSF